MTTTLAHPPTTDLPAVRPLRFPTLLAVETRKMLDTRSGRGLIAAALALATGVLAWKLAHPVIAADFGNYSGGVESAVVFIVPLLGLMAMTAEWTQRTALKTFTLAPRRLPVFAAKYAAALLVSLAALAAGLALSAVAVGVGGALHGPASFAGWAGDVRGAVVLVVLQVTLAAAFGALVANTPVALSAYLLAPTVWSLVAENVLGVTAEWFDVFRAYDRLSSPTPLAHGARTLSAVALWIVLPAVIGLARTLRREIK